MCTLLQDETFLILVKNLMQTNSEHHAECLPTRGSEKSAGFDLYACWEQQSGNDQITIEPWTRKLIPTGIAISVPCGTYGRIAPKFGLAANHCIDVGAGVIDPDYRGEVKVLLINNSNTPFEVKRGDRIAQLILEQFTSDVEVLQVDDFPDASKRGI